MSDNLLILDAASASQNLRSTDNSTIHSPHQVAEYLVGTTPTPVTSTTPLPVTLTGAGGVSTSNSTSTLLTASSVFTGTSEDVSAYDSVIVAVKTDQDGLFTVQFSADNTNWDSTLTRYYRTGQIEAPHRFTVARQYMRVTFTNSSATDQTYLRLQTIYGDKGSLNAPIDSTLAQDFDATAVRPSDYNQEVALGRRQGSTLWNKFGYNNDLDVGTEVVASFGGTYNPMTTARTLSVVSTSTADDDGSTGANSILIYGLDANREAQTVVVTLNGTTPVVTTETWLGVNRMSIYISGTGQVNAGDITATATTDLTIQAQIPTGSGTSEQCMFFTQTGHQAMAEWVTINTLKQTGGTAPVVTVKGWVYSAVSNSRYEVFRETIDTSVSNKEELKPPLPFPIGEKSAFWLEATTDKANTVVNCRFSLIEHRDAST